MSRYKFITAIQCQSCYEISVDPDTKIHKNACPVVAAEAAEKEELARHLATIVGPAEGTG